MKRFLFKTGVSMGLLAATLFLLKSSVPYYWPNDVFAQKAERIKGKTLEFDTYFFGSSHTYRTINPLVFDRITSLNSYNMGAGGTFHLETHYLAEQFLRKNEIQKGANLVFRKMVPNEISSRNLGTPRTTYSMDWKRLKMGIDYFSSKDDLTQVNYHVKAYLYRLFSVGMPLDILEYHFRVEEPQSMKIQEQKGFLAYDQEIKERLDLDKIARLRRRVREKERLIEKGKVKANKSKVKIKGLTHSEAQLFPDYKYYRIIGNPIPDTDLLFDRGHYNLRGAQDFSKEFSRKFRDYLAGEGRRK